MAVMPFSISYTRDVSHSVPVLTGTIPFQVGTISWRGFIASNHSVNKDTFLTGERVNNNNWFCVLVLLLNNISDRVIYQWWKHPINNIVSICTNIYAYRINIVFLWVSMYIKLFDCNRMLFISKLIIYFQIKCINIIFEYYKWHFDIKN